MRLLRLAVIRLLIRIAGKLIDRSMPREVGPMYPAELMTRTCGDLSSVLQDE